MSPGELLDVIAIDGPGGSGKSTVAREVARVIGADVLDTGAMYRAVAFAVLREGIDTGDEEAVAAVAKRSQIEVGDRVLVDGEDCTTAIRGPEVTAAVSAVSAHPLVREFLVAQQRAWIAEHGLCVLEGRDIGTVVAPNARVKIFLTARDDVRATRRARDEAIAERQVSMEEVREAINRRDHLDSSRAAAPLVTADDAIVIDTSQLGIEEVVADVVERYRAGGATRRSSKEARVDLSPGDELTTQFDERVTGQQAARTGDEQSQSAGGSNGHPVVRSGPPGRRRVPSSAEMGRRWMVFRSILIGLTRVLWRVEVVHRERLPRVGACVIAPSHRSYTDWLMVGCITRRPLHFMAKAELWKAPRIGRFLNWVGTFPVDREIPDRAALRASTEALQQGDLLVIFPEGTTREGPLVEEVQEGAAFLALRAGVSIVPVGIAGTAAILGKGQKRPRFFRPVVVVVGNPIAVEVPGGRVRRSDIANFSEQAREAIQRCFDEAEARLAAR